MSGKDRETVGRSDEDAEDVRLMQLVSGGDTSAFEELVDRHQSLVAGTVARMLGSRLLKITRNLVFNELRRSKRHALVPLQSEPGAEEFPLKDEKNPAPDASLLETELEQAIEDAIMQLPESQRMALVLRRYEQLSYEEIAEVLDLSVPAVKSVLFRARTELRARLSRYLA